MIISPLFDKLYKISKVFNENLKSPEEFRAIVLKTSSSIFKFLGNISLLFDIFFRYS